MVVCLCVCLYICAVLLYDPYTVAAIDPVAFVLETDTTQEKTDSGTSSLGGLMEDDESRASAAEDSDDILIPPSTPSRRNAARQSNSSWLLRALSYGVGLLLATWPYAAL